MVGFLFRLVVVVAVIGVIALIFEFRFAGGELRVRNRWSKPAAEVIQEIPARAKEKIPEESRRKLERIIEEAE